MIEKLQKENVQLKDEVSSQTNSIAKNKASQSSTNLVNAAEEIRMIKEKMEEEKMMQDSMDEDIRTL